VLWSWGTEGVVGLRKRSDIFEGGQVKVKMGWMVVKSTFKYHHILMIDLSRLWYVGHVQ
jgi:hypothetical protein